MGGVPLPRIRINEDKEEVNDKEEEEKNSEEEEKIENTYQKEETKKRNRKEKNVKKKMQMLQSTLKDLDLMENLQRSMKIKSKLEVIMGAIIFTLGILEGEIKQK